MTRITERGCLRTLSGSRALRCLAIALLIASQSLYAATITVDGTTCNLIDAINAANNDAAVGGCSAGAGPDILDLGASVSLSAVDNGYYGPNGLPVIRSDITVDGNGFTIERIAGSPEFRFFQMATANATLSLNDVTLTNGYLDPAGGFTGGAIASPYANPPGSVTVNLTRTVLLANSAAGGGAMSSRAGSVVNITDSTITGNYGSFGGGLFLNRSPTTIVGTTISANSTANFAGGGGAYLYAGGGAYGTMTVTNSTISGNTDGVRGGGIWASVGPIIVTNSTVSGNSSPVGGGINFLGAGSTFVVNNSIIADNLGGGDCSGPITDGGNNFDADASCAGGGFTPITPGVDFDTTLANNGGPTETHALFMASIARDAAGVCGLATDQRGVARSDGACDSGAYEFRRVLWRRYCERSG